MVCRLQGVDLKVLGLRLRLRGLPRLGLRFVSARDGAGGARGKGGGKGGRGQGGQGGRVGQQEKLPNSHPLLAFDLK